MQMPGGEWRRREKQFRSELWKRAKRGEVARQDIPDLVSECLIDVASLPFETTESESAMRYVDNVVRRYWRDRREYRQELPGIVSEDNRAARLELFQAIPGKPPAPAAQQEVVEEECGQEVFAGVVRWNADSVSIAVSMDIQEARHCSAAAEWYLVVVR